jgi:probable F420-dependent oxidoreductase
MAEKIGLDGMWLIQLPNMRDNLSILAAMAMTTERISLGAGIMPLYTCPPVVMAQTAATIDELSGGRFTLGLGMGHKLTGEWSLGVPGGPPLASMREYLAVVRGLLREGEAHLDGAHYRGHATYGGPVRKDMATCVGALGPKMCELAGEHADGLLLWMSTVDYVRDVAIPALHEGLRRSGRSPDGFPVVVLAPATVSDDVDFDRDLTRKYVGTYARMPNYRRMFEGRGFGDDMGAGRVSDRLVDALAVTGDEAAVRERMVAFHEAGATEVCVVPMARAYHDLGRWQTTVEAALG